MGFMRSFIMGLMGSIGFGRMGAAMSAALEEAILTGAGRKRADHSLTTHRRPGARAHRKWAHKRAAGRA